MHIKSFLAELLDLLRTRLAGKTLVLLAYLVILVGALFYCIKYPREEIALWLNQWNTRILDYPMLWITYIGTAPAYLLLILAILWKTKSRNIFCSGLVAFACTAITTQVLKRLFFYNIWRPLAVIPQLFLQVPFPKDIELQYSFPSGHSTVIFALFALICYYSSRSLLIWLSLGIAILVAYSRMYLLRHFLIDITVGSMIGLGIGLLSLACWELLNRRKSWVK